MKKSDLRRYVESARGIPLLLNSYEDIFSDFDPRPYSQKALSGDFLLECKKASLDKKGKVRIRLFLPKHKRDSLKETTIKKRLKDHFNKHLRQKKKEIRKIKLNGLFWFLFGSLMIVLATIFLNYKGFFLFNLLITLLLPAGWFFMWEGLGKIFIVSKDRMPDYLFYKKMAGSEISFANI
jgi:hypothetical protein